MIYLILLSSEIIVGIPSDDETLLNPALNDEATANGELKDAKTSDVRSSFEYDSIDT